MLVDCITTYNTIPKTYVCKVGKKQGKKNSPGMFLKMVTAFSSFFWPFNLLSLPSRLSWWLTSWPPSPDCKCPSQWVQVHIQWCLVKYERSDFSELPRDCLVSITTKTLWKCHWILFLLQWETNIFTIFSSTLLNQDKQACKDILNNGQTFKGHWF